MREGYQKTVKTGLEASLVLIFFSLPLPSAWGSISFSLGVIFLLCIRYGLQEVDHGFRNIPPLTFPVIFYVGAVLLAAVLGINPRNSFTHADNLYRILYAYLLFSALNTVATLPKMLLAFGVTATLDALYALTPVAGTVAFRVKGFSWHPNILASMMVCMLLFNVVFLLFYPLERRHKIMLSLSGIFLLTALMMTQSRGALIGFVATLMVVSLYVDWKKAMLVGGCLLLLFLIQPSHLKARQISSFDAGTSGGRPVIWENSIEIIRDYPWGIGQDNFAEKFLQYAKKDIESGTIQAQTHAHNNLLQIQAEFGFLGLFSYLWIWKTILVYCVKTINLLKTVVSRRFEYLFLVATFAYFFAFHVAGLFDFNWGFPATSIAVWSLVGIAFWIGERKET